MRRFYLLFFFHGFRLLSSLTRGYLNIAPSGQASDKIKKPAKYQINEMTDEVIDPEGIEYY